jgi:hypothetical protein
MEKHVISEESLSSSTVVGSLSYYFSSMLIFSITAIDANSNNFKKSTESLSTVIGLRFHGRQNFKKLGYEIPAPRSPLPAHVLAFPGLLILSRIRILTAERTLCRIYIKSVSGCTLRQST